MLLIFRALYLLLIGYLFFLMFRRGGCCGGHGHQHRSYRSRNEYDTGKSQEIISDDEKNRAIDI